MLELTIINQVTSRGMYTLNFCITCTYHVTLEPLRLPKWIGHSALHCSLGTFITDEGLLLIFMRTTRRIL
jgi:hypothetical protein